MLHQLPGNPVELRDPVPVRFPTRSTCKLPLLCRLRMLSVWLSYRGAALLQRGSGRKSGRLFHRRVRFRYCMPYLQ